MGAFVDRSDIKTVRDADWAEWEEADIGRLDSAAHDRIRAQVLVVTGGTQVDEEGKLVPMTKQQHTMARVPVVYEGLMAPEEPRWTFTENEKPPSDKNPPMPITRETVGKLERRYSKFLYEQIEEFNADWTEEERQAFFRAVRGGLQGGGSVSP